jgi:hypothetical protein
MNKVPRTYLYYSDDKILEFAMDAASTSELRQEFERFRKVEVKVLGSGGTIELAPREPDTILGAMKKVWHALDKEGQIGTPEDDKPYFHGGMMLYQGFFDTVNPPVWFFVGETDRTIIALGGRAKHARAYPSR